MQAGAAAAVLRMAAPMRKGVRKITPTGPQQPAAAAAPPPQLPTEMAAALARTAHSGQLQLQSAFLLMYSNPESKVCLPYWPGPLVVPYVCHGVGVKRRLRLLPGVLFEKRDNGLPRLWWGIVGGSPQQTLHATACAEEAAQRQGGEC